MLQGKTAVITGGVRGIGKCIAETFCKNGANVIICDISSPEAAAKTEEELKAYGTRVRMYNGDITDPQTAENIAQIIKDEFDKKVDILVNNAGITNDKLMIKMKPEEFTKVIDVNLNGAFYMTKAISALMIKQRSGSIISMSSVSGLKGNPGTGQLQRVQGRSGRYDSFRCEGTGQKRYPCKRHRAGICRNGYDSRSDR